MILSVAALAPIAWGSGYFVTDTFLPPDRPLFGATVRALPFGLILLVWRRQLPSGAWWWRSAALGILNIAAFFVLVFVAAYRLPGGLAATLTAAAPFAVALLAWSLLGERPRRATLAGALVGVGGVVLLVAGDGFAVDVVGVAAALGAVVLFSLGSVLMKRWTLPTDLLTVTAWQLVAGGLLLVPLAAVVEGAPPRLDASAIGGFAYIGLVGTVLAYSVWFRALRHLPASSVSLVGLLNPLAGTVIGVTLAGEPFGPTQAIGTALILGGIVAGQSFRRRRSEPRAVPRSGACGVRGPVPGPSGSNPAVDRSRKPDTIYPV